MRKLLLIAAIVPTLCSAQTDATNGDWKERFVVKQNTPEADYMIRYGDVDNLGFGWEDKFNPFSGISTTGHPWPMEREDKTEFPGFDLVNLSTSFKKPEMSRDGYSGARAYLIKTFKATNFEYKIPMKSVDTSKIKSVTLQIFVDDFQPREFGSKFEFYLNRKRYEPAEKILNALHQGGPIGKLITIKITPDRIKDFKQDTLRMLFDDKTTGIGDGWAIDFIKILVNPKNINKGGINGTLIGADGAAIPNATVQYEGQSVKTNAEGKFKMENLPAGLVILNVTTADEKKDDIPVDVEASKITDAELKMEKKEE